MKPSSITLKAIHGLLHAERPCFTLRKAVFRTPKGHELPTRWLSAVCAWLLIALASAPACAQERSGDLGDGTFANPVLWIDTPDPDVIRVGGDYYMVNTTMFYTPGAPVMHSKDLVNWQIVSYIYDRLDDTPRYGLRDGTAYGRGQWATSLRYHDGTFYAYFSPNDEPWQGYVYTTKDPRRGWTLHSRLPHFHDASLFFDDDGRVYMFYGTGQLRELKPDLTGVKPGGVDMKIFERDPSENSLLEGSRAIKYQGKYYLLMISWPKDGNRRQVCYRADSITGPYEKRVILEDNFAGFPYVAQGCIVDDTEGRWYGVIFQDRNAVGRVLTLMPCTPVKGQKAAPLLVGDGFGGDKLDIHWQWNHNPVDSAWSLKARPGWLRLATSRVVDNVFLAPNTLTQRMAGPTCSATVKLDVSGMKDGDVAGFSALNGDAGLLSVVCEGSRKYLVMTEESVSLRDKDKAVTAVSRTEHMRTPLSQDIVYLRIDADFRLGKDTALFYYSLDGDRWTAAGPAFKMRFDYRRFFTGTRFAVYCYATKATGGHVDVDWFKVR